jgi:hypothetical protein
MRARASSFPVRDCPSANQAVFDPGGWGMQIAQRFLCSSCATTVEETTRAAKLPDCR